jgi:hypothetical protein
MIDIVRNRQNSHFYTGELVSPTIKNTLKSIVIFAELARWLNGLLTLHDGAVKGFNLLISAESLKNSLVQYWKQMVL